MYLRDFEQDPEGTGERRLQRQIGQHHYYGTQQAVLCGGAVIVAEDVHMHFRSRLFRRLQALNGVSLEVRDGDFFALVGQNGAGKSTAMYCFLGLLRPTSGKVEIMGQRPELGCRLYENVAYLPEEPHYHLYLTVEEATRYYASLYGKRVPAKIIHDVL